MAEAQTEQTAKQKKAAEKAAKAAAKAEESSKKVQANGVTRPAAGTKTGRIWEITDEISAQLKAPAPRKDVIAKATTEGINESTAATQYGRWRKFHGLKGPLTPAATETPAAPKA